MLFSLVLGSYQIRSIIHEGGCGFLGLMRQKIGVAMRQTMFLF